MPREYTVYAIDFDGTLCEGMWPEIGVPNMMLIEFLHRRKLNGDKLILWICREGERLNEAIRYCNAHGLEFDTINENLPEFITEFYGDSRKIFADFYIDDKGIDPNKFNLPYKGVDGK